MGNAAVAAVRSVDPHRGSPRCKAGACRLGLRLWSRRCRASGFLLVDEHAPVDGAVGRRGARFGASWTAVSGEARRSRVFVIFLICILVIIALALAGASPA